MKTARLSIVLTAVLLISPFATPVLAQQAGTEQAAPFPKNKAPTNASKSSPYLLGVLNDFLFPIVPNSLEKSKDLGVQSSRISLYWQWIEPVEGTYNWSKFDQIIEGHYKAGISLMITLKCDNAWGSRSGYKYQTSSPPIEMWKYERWVQKVVERYKDKVKLWQIENEIGDKTLFEQEMWDGTKEEYVDLLKHAHDTIKRVDPDAEIVLSGFAHAVLIQVDKGNPNITAFFEYLMNAAKDYYDYGDFHQYYSPEDVAMEVNLLRETMQKYGPVKDLFCSEIGDMDLRLFPVHIGHLSGKEIPIVKTFLSFESVRIKLIEYREDGRVNSEEAIEFAMFMKSDPQMRSILEEFQSENLVKRVCLTFSMGVKRIYHLALFDSQNPQNFFHAFMGLVDTEGRKKPQYFTYKLLIKKVKNFTTIADLSFNPDKRFFKFSFSDPNRAPVFVLWSTQPETTNLTSYFGKPRLKATDIITQLDSRNQPVFPKPRIIPASSVPSTKTPIFLE